jgi:choline dehydrogenase-like flavoprotein
VHDVIVIGSGASGSWAAKELCERGLKVLMLEAGRAIDAERDFSARPGRQGMLPTRLDRALKGQHLQARCANFAAHTSQFYVNDRENPYSYPRGRPFYWFRGRQVGGRLHTWCRAALRMSDAELKPSEHGKDGPDWPLSYGDLEPYYDRVETFLGLLGARADLPGLPDGRYTDPMPLSQAERRFLEKTEKEKGGVRAGSGRIIRHNPRRIPLPILAALDTGNLTTQSNAAVSHILIDKETGRAGGVAYVDCPTKTWREVKAKAVVLCASAFESVRILLNSACPRHPGGVGNSSGLLGKYISDHLMIGLRGRMPDGSWEPETVDGKDPYDFGVTGLYIQVSSPKAGGGLSAPRAFGIQCGMGGGGPTWWMLAFGEMSMLPTNRVTIDPRRKDAWGIPAARIECAHSPEDEAQIAVMRNTMLELAERESYQVVMPHDEKTAYGMAFRALRRVIFAPTGAFWPGASIHEVGGARMGSDPGESVVNPFNQCWDSPNVFVCDGASFVSTGYQNHTLTIMAQTVRACEHLVAAAKRGDL